MPGPIVGCTRHWLISTQVVNTIHLAHFSPNIKRYKLKRKLKAAVFAIIAEHRFLASIARANPARCRGASESKTRRWARVAGHA